MFEWIALNQTALWWLAIASIISFVGTLALIPVLVVRIPEDYFAKTKRHRWEPWAHQHPVIRWTLLIAKNIVGYIFITLGRKEILEVHMKTIKTEKNMGIRFFGEFLIERWVVTRGPVLTTINRLRHRAGHAPLIT